MGVLAPASKGNIEIAIAETTQIATMRANHRVVVALIARRIALACPLELKSRSARRVAVL